jgi:hypothetical protein
MQKISTLESQANHTYEKLLHKNDKIKKKSRQSKIHVGQKSPYPSPSTKAAPQGL